MPIRLAGNPPGGSELVLNALRTHAGPTPQAARAVGGTDTHVTIALPHPVFDLGLDQLVANADLAQARSGGWRYLVMQGPSAIAAAEVTTDAVGQALSVSSVNRGPFVEATHAGIREAERLPPVQSGSFELRLLRIPALYIVALWLKDTADDADTIIPLAPAPNYLTPGHTYSVQAFLELTRGAARRQSVFDSSPQREPGDTGR